MARIEYISLVKLRRTYIRKNTLRLTNKLLALPLLIFIYSCSIDLPDEGEYLRWTTTFQVPLIEDKITLETLAEDSLISVEGLAEYFQDGTINDSIFVYHKKIDIEKVEVGDRLEIDPISTNFSQNIDDVTVSGVEKNISSSVGIISLGNIEPAGTDPFIFSDIYPDIIDVPNGQSVAIPAFEIDPIINPFSFEDFGYAEFSGGILDITITNNMVIPLGPPILIQLRQVADGDTTDIPGATIEFDELINANDGSATGSLDLSGVTLPGSILVQVSGNCLGTSGIPILIDESAKNSSFTVTIGGSDLEVTSATAKIPEQLIQESGVMNLEPDSNKVVRATINSGNLIIEVDNYMELSSTLNISIPNLLSPNEDIFTTEIDITGGTSDIVDATDMANYSLAMDADSQSISYSYSVLTLDTGDDLVPITSADSINVQIRLEGAQTGSDITFSEFTGFLNQDAMVDSNKINLETATRVDQATLNSGNLKLSIVNNIGIEALINFSLTEFTKDGETLDTTFSMSSDPLDVLIDLSGYLLNLDIDSNPQIINYVSTINIPSEEEMSLTFGQNISIDVNIDSLSFSELSGYVDPVEVDIDPIEQSIDLPEQVDDLDFAKLIMDFSFQSSIALPVFLNLELTSYNDKTEESFSRLIENVNITETPEFSVDSVEQLINIKPDRIVASGNARVGSMFEYGSVSVQDTISGNLTIAAPLAFEITDESKIDIDPSELDSISAENLVSVKVFLDYNNSLEIGADVSVLLATDTTFFENGLSDTLAKLTLQPSAPGLDSLFLDESSFDLLSRGGNYSKAVLNLLPREDGPTRFLSTDTLDFFIYLSTEVIIDPNSGSEK